MGKRLSLTLSDEAGAGLATIKARLGAASEAEVVRRALRLLYLATKPGARVLVERQGVAVEVVL